VAKASKMVRELASCEHIEPSGAVRESAGRPLIASSGDRRARGFDALVPNVRQCTGQLKMSAILHEPLLGPLSHQVRGAMNENRGDVTVACERILVPLTGGMSLFFPTPLPKPQGVGSIC